jgi:hypothetical protein
VQDEDRLAGRIADRRIGQPQLGHDLAGVELEVLGDPVAGLRCGIVGGDCRCGDERQDQRDKHALHAVLPALRWQELRALSGALHALPDRRLPAGIMLMSRLEAGGPED